VRVLLVGDVYPDSFADNLVTSLSDAGHVVEAVGAFPKVLTGPGRSSARIRAELPWLPRAARRLQRHVVQAAEALGPELILNIDFRLSWPIVQDLKSVSGAPAAFWFPDAPGNLGRETHVLAAYDGVFVKDSSVARIYRDVLGLNAHFLPEACNPRWHRPPSGLSPGEGGNGVLVAGNMYSTRFVLLRRLADAGIKVELYGPPWPRWLPEAPALTRHRTGTYLARQAKAKAFRAANIVLNPLASHEADGANCRLFEAAGCGAVVLTERRARLGDLFSVPGEVRAFESFDGLVAQIRELSQADAASRLALGDAAASRAHREHTYSQRFDRLAELLARG